MAEHKTMTDRQIQISTAVVQALITRLRVHHRLPGVADDVAALLADRDRLLLIEVKQRLPDPHPGPWTWTGPLESDLMPDGVTLRHVVPPERWPFCYASEHDGGCKLHEGGLYCDCGASAADDDGVVL